MSFLRKSNKARSGLLGDSHKPNDDNNDDNDHNNSEHNTENVPIARRINCAIGCRRASLNQPNNDNDYYNDKDDGDNKSDEVGGRPFGSRCSGSCYFRSPGR